MKIHLLAIAFVMLVVSAPAFAAPSSSAFGQCRSDDDCFIITVDDGCGRQKMACVNINDDMSEYRQQVSAGYERKKPNCSTRPSPVPDCACSAHRCIPARHAHMR